MLLSVEQEIPAKTYASTYYTDNNCHHLFFPE